MNEQVTLRVRPGFVHGAKRQFQNGDTFAVTEAEAEALLAAFGDKLERVEATADDGLPTADIQAETPAVEVETPERATRRTRKPGGL